jgi:predicted small integral membrane protein
VAKSLLYRLFGVGRIPKLLGDRLRMEGIVIADEGISGSVTYRDFRAPGRYSSWRKQAFIGSIVITNIRLVGLMSSRFAVNVPFSDARIRQLRISTERDRLLIALDASLFHDDWSGTIEYRYRTSQAADIIKWIHDLTQT